MSAVIERQKSLPATTDAVTPMQMLQMAVQQGADLDRLQKLMDLQERWEANQARKAYVAAFAEFKRNAPDIVKDKHVSFVTNRGTTSYDHASLANVCESIIAALSAVGITHRWTVDQPENRIAVTCILTHVDGHSEATTLKSGSDDSGGKNGIQAISSAVTYLQRYTLLSATGLSTREDDDGGKAGELQDDPVGKSSPKGPPVKVDGATVDRLVSRFQDCFDADIEEDQKARAVYAVHLDAAKDNDVYMAVGTRLGSKLQRAIRTYVTAHKEVLNAMPPT